MTLKIECILNGPFEENCYLVWKEGSTSCLVIDPGSSPDMLQKAAQKAGVRPSLIVATHAHVDHVGAVHALKETFQAPFAMHEGDQEQLDMLEDAYSYYGFGTTKKPAVDRVLKDGDTVEAGDLKLKVIATPGHSQGSLCLYHDSGVLFSGDTLFRRSVGRYDFPGGSREQLQKSIQSRLYTLPDATVVYPGHGESTTIGEEKRENPFIQSLGSV
jgi:glyoxylase-like metal-dependent hydrolase (beta-lactamase superfamily II)